MRLSLVILKESKGRLKNLYFLYSQMLRLLRRLSMTPPIPPRFREDGTLLLVRYRFIFFLFSFSSHVFLLTSYVQTHFPLDNSFKYFNITQ